MKNSMLISSNTPNYFNSTLRSPLGKKTDKMKAMQKTKVMQRNKRNNKRKLRMRMEKTIRSKAKKINKIVMMKKSES